VELDLHIIHSHESALGNPVEQRPRNHGRFITSPETRICTATAGCWHLQPTLPHDHLVPAFLAPPQDSRHFSFFASLFPAV